MNPRLLELHSRGAWHPTTRDLAAAAKQLRKWHASFSRIARTALKDKPGLVEKIGILDRSAARRKAAPVNGSTS